MVDSNEIENNEIISISQKYAIKNCFEHGRADVGAVIGKVKALFPSIEISEIISLVKKIVDETNSLERSVVEEKFLEYEEQGWELKHVEKEKTLQELDWLKEGEQILTRVAPNPSGAMHFGHARPALLSDEYVRKYGGKLFVRFDDTDPKIKKPLDGIEEEFLKEFEWLGIRVSGISNASNNLEQYYEIIEELLKREKAYICFCEPEDWRKKIWKSESCECRQKNASEQLLHWKKMLSHELKEGSCVVRLKTDLFDKDSSTRDWWLARIVDEVEHPNKKAIDKHVWPSYNFASAIDDHSMGINFIIRGQEHIPNEKKQRQLYDFFGWVYPHTKYHGKISQVGDMVLSKSKIKVLMDKQGLSRDDDPRLATLKSFRRRGFKPETIRKIIFELGLNINEAKIGLENFAAINKSFLGRVNNFDFFDKSIEVEVSGFEKGEIKNNKQVVLVDEPLQKFVLDRNEIEQIKKRDIIRFREGFNARIEEVSESKIRASFVDYNSVGHKQINWIKNKIKIIVLMSNGKERTGLSNELIVEEKENNVISLNNIGFVRIEKIDFKNKQVYCVYAHN